MFELCQEQLFKSQFKQTNIPYTFEFFIKEFHIFVTRDKYEFLNIESYIYINRHNFRNVLIYNVSKIDTTL